MTANPLEVPPNPADPFQPRSGQRGTGFLTDPFQLGLTPSATVGPYLAIGLTWEDGELAADEGTPGAFWIRGRVFDGAGEVVPDAMIETWQADPDGGLASPEDPRGAATYPGFRGYARAQTLSGEYAVHTLKPGRLPDGAGGLQAPHIDVSVFARGLLDRVVTRIYFADEEAANAEDAVLRALPSDEDRRTLIATPSEDGYRFDVRLQGDGETVFFAV
ncbi:protocatechuate 3,4-dioxygenase subunit alpha [Blastococcus xanthinilyticus]|uniref:Protocatechuate 3,4-dioxygenase alpha subunit n=1 Tax=Blastococcus xanthinilyticus TaxID=1564164 RepID=A0A5S5D596_9ACTN|nr:protocatechuate 3,4-dioxygenase subunit alpha [Blastococcus xanthinilyticus]TYP90336.1 protocatechuate 3,4-dioxygenase alpha subunit [Blastococcus xanthinilyticus]